MKKYFRDQITVDADNAMALSEGAALTLIKAKINNRYDLTKLFPVILSWSNATSYAIGDYAVGSNDNFYICTTANTNQNPTTASSYWAASDPRDGMLVMNCIYIAIFFFFKSADKRKITEDLSNDFASACDWFDMVKGGQENPDWILLPDAASIPIAGSRPPEQTYRW
ncbi:MAG TPA: hypothetical protein VN698_09750 [Bacteroidia bacterium]|nr:hypothetical protein [Bacteroidia bacterium]